MILAENKRTHYKIICAADAGRQVMHAAEELRTYLNRITGASFQLYMEGERPLEIRPDRHLNGQYLPERDTYIYVGDTVFIGRMGYTVPRELGKEGFSIRTVGDTLYIAGGKPRGVLYGVYTFLETYCGCRWFTDEISRIPSRAVLVIPEINDTQVPVLEYREAHYTAYGDADWHVRNKLNSTASLLSDVYGGKITYKGFVHTFNDLINPKDYFDTHPEYFSEINGVRKNHPTQLCLTNPEVLALAKKQVRAWLAENPNVSIVSVSQNDWGHFCTCEKCRALDAQEGSHMGTVLTFVNAIADDIREDYPDVAIDTLAYQYTRKPPKTVRPHDNVIIRLCSIECCFAHPLEECDYAFSHWDGCDNTFREDLIAWGKISHRLHIWDYVVNFHHNLLPHPNWGVLQKNIQFFVKNNVVGVFEQGNSFRGRYGEFDLMKQYVLAKLMWDPDCDMDVHVNEYLHGVYGAAAGEVRRYYDLLRGLIGPDTHLWIYHNPDAAYLTDAFLEAGDACLARAEIAADDDETLQRVRVLRLSTRYAILCRMAMDDPRREPGWDAFYRDVTAAGIDTFYWRQLPDRALEFLRAGDLKFGRK
ncbi:MAG: DUF4838 domain-containing protein [Ruminococcaceae bacterium]|nr:DUF4838 domain-containing protein [Oscillospiraceae bacterium]